MGGFLDLARKVVLVTGANSGIGLAAAHGLAEAGADVALWGRRVERNETARRSLADHGTRVWSDVVDVSDEDQVTSGLERVVSELGRVDAVFVNAGIFHRADSFVDLTVEDYRSLLAVNLDGAFFTMRAAVAHMVDREGGGSVIVNGSLSAFGGVPGMQHYGAAKGALQSMVKGVAVEYGQHGIRANMVCPGFIARDEGSLSGGGPIDEMVRSRCPIPRRGTPADIAGIVAYLVSDLSRYHTGDTITVDGGWTASVL